MNIKKILATAMSALFAFSAASVIATAGPVTRNDKNIARTDFLDFSEASTTPWAAEVDGKWTCIIESGMWEYPDTDGDGVQDAAYLITEGYDSYEKGLEWSLTENREVLHLELNEANKYPGLFFSIDEMHDDNFFKLGTENGTTPRAQYLKIRVRNYSTASRFTFGWVTGSTNNGHFVSATISDMKADMYGNEYQSGTGEWVTYIVDMPQLNKDTNYNGALKVDDNGDLQHRWGSSLYEFAIFPFGYNVSDGTGPYVGASLDIDYIVIGDLDYVTNYKSELELKEESITDLKLISAPTKTSYYVGETIDLEGLQLEATYADGTKETLTSASYSVNLNTAAASTPVTLRFGSKSVEYNVSVTGISSIELSASPEDTTFEIAELANGFTPSGYEFKVNYTDGTSSAPYSTGALKYIGDFTAAGTTTVTANYYGITTTFDVNLIQVSDIEVTAPEKAYRYGSEIKEDDFTINLIYTDGTKVASGDAATELEYTITGSTKVPGQVEFTVQGVNTTYGLDITKTVAVNVEAPTAMVVTKEPVKTTYDVGAEFDPTGMTVSFEYADGKKVALVADDYRIRANLSTPGEGAGRVTISSTIDGVDLSVVLNVNVEGEIITTQQTTTSATTTAPSTSEGAPIGLIIGIVAAVVVVAVVVVVVVLGKKKKK